MNTESSRLNEDYLQGWDQRKTLAPPPYQGAFKKYLTGLNIGDPLLDSVDMKELFNHSAGNAKQAEADKVKKANPDKKVTMVDNIIDMDDPEWVDWPLVERGQKLWQKHLARSVVSLSVGLITGFSIARFGEVLLKAGYAQSAHSAFERYNATAEAMIDWFTGDLHKGGRGRHSVIIVRKMHAFARRKAYHLFDATKGEGIPLSQFDMAEVLLGFGAVPLTVMKEIFEVDIPREDQEAMTHFWRFIGYLLGIYDEYNPCRSLDELLAVYEDYRMFITARFRAHRESSNELQRTALIGFGEGGGVGTHIWTAFFAAIQKTKAVQSFPYFTRDTKLIYRDPLPGFATLGRGMIWALKQDWIASRMNQGVLLSHRKSRATSPMNKQRLYKFLSFVSVLMDNGFWTPLGLLIAYRRLIYLAMAFLAYKKLLKN